MGHLYHGYVIFLGVSEIREDNQLPHPKCTQYRLVSKGETSSVHGLSFRRSKSSSDWSVKVSKAGYHKNIPHDFMATYAYNQYIYIYCIHIYILYIYILYWLKSRQTIGFYTLRLPRKRISHLRAGVTSLSTIIFNASKEKTRF